MTPILLAVLLTVAQDTSTIDRGVRIGIIYRPGVRPGLVMLPRKGGASLDSVRAIVSRDLDFSDRFEVITLPGGDSIRLATSPTTTRGTAPRRSSSGNSSGGAQTAGSTLNYPLYQALGADFALDITAAGDTTVATLHDIAGAPYAPRCRRSRIRISGRPCIVWRTKRSRRRSARQASPPRASCSSRTVRCIRSIRMAST
jgi:hypothetical protein